MTRLDVTIALLVAAVGSWAGTRAVQAFQAAGGQQYFYQSDFGPAVLLACGRPLADPDTARAPALEAFLAQRTRTFDCADLPNGLATAPMNPFQAAVRYLEIAVALTWKLTGVSWPRLAVLNGVLFGAVAALTFVVLRIALPVALALLLLVPSVTSTPNFMLVPQLRDYAKGPFLLAAIAIMAILVTGAPTARRVLALAALGGLVVGVGLGFRADLAIAVAPFMVTLALLLPRGVSPAVRTTAVGLFLLTTASVSYPVLRVGAGGNNGHVVVLGLVSDFDGPLRIQPSIYTFGGPYVDSLAATTIDAYGIRVEGHAAAAAMSADYEHLAGGYLRAVATTFPADVATRVIAAIRTVSKYFLDSSLYPPVQIGSEAIRSLYPLRARVLWRLGQLAFIACAAAMLLVSARNPRAAWLVIVVMVGFAGASAIQFNERHFYYLQFVPWLAFGVLANIALSFRAHWRATTRDEVVRAVVFGAVVFGGAAALVTLSRAYQQRSARRLFAEYEAAPQTPLVTHPVAVDGGRTRLTADEWSRPIPAGSPSIGTRFLAVIFRGDRCGGAHVPLTIRYDGRRRDADLTQTIDVRLASAPGPTTVFVAAYDWSDDYVRFRGLEIPSGQAECIGSVSRVAGMEHAPLLLTTTLRAGWQQEKLYQRLD